MFFFSIKNVRSCINNLSLIKKIEKNTTFSSKIEVNDPSGALKEIEVLSTIASVLGNDVILGDLKLAKQKSLTTEYTYTITF